MWWNITKQINRLQISSQITNLIPQFIIFIFCNISLPAVTICFKWDMQTLENKLTCSEIQTKWKYFGQAHSQK